MYTEKFIRRFWRDVDRSGNPDDCQEWTGYRHSWGYGRVTYRYTDHLCHRVAYELENGQIPPGLQVRHTCDNPACCNPRHLILGTTQDNTADREERGRGAKGERHGMYGKANPSARGRSHHLNVLTEDEVREIRRLHAAGSHSYTDLSILFGVSKSNISAIVTRKSWDWLE